MITVYGTMGGKQWIYLYQSNIYLILNRVGMKKYVAAEMCETLNDHWGWATDFNYKSPALIIKNLCKCRKVGANF